VSELAKWQRNALYDAVVAGGLDPSECKVQADDTGTVITHTASRAHFTVTPKGSHYRTQAVVEDTPGWPSPLDRYRWEAVTDPVKLWASNVKDDAETPDMWAELQRERELFSGVWTTDGQNTPFTVEDRTAIADQLRQLKELVSTRYALSAMQIDSLENTLGYLADASTRAGRRDWALLVAGATLSWIVQSLVPQDAAQHILSIVMRGVRDLIEGGLWGGPSQLPGGA
jgi:hypothetical protein